MPLLQLGVRFYNPATGVFTQRDPVLDGVNWYSYVSGRVMIAVDPSGLECSMKFTGTRLILFVDGMRPISIPAYSGWPGTSRDDVNNPNGPIPPGEYKVDFCSYRLNKQKCNWLERMKGRYFDGDYSIWGRARVCITPEDKASMHKRYPRREAFLQDKKCVYTIHGGDFINSQGCIDIGHRDLAFLETAPILCGCGPVSLTVDYADWGGKVPGSGTNPVLW